MMVILRIVLGIVVESRQKIAMEIVVVARQKIVLVIVVVMPKSTNVMNVVALIAVLMGLLLFQLMVV